MADIVNWTYWTEQTESALDLIIAIVNKLPEIVLPLAMLIIVLVVPRFATKIVDKITGIFDKVWK